MAAVRPRARARLACGVCGRRAPGYDRGEGRRRWRALDLGATMAFVEAEAPRVECRRHGVVVGACAVGAARLAVHARVRAAGRVAGDAVLEAARSAELMRISWRTVGPDHASGSSLTRRRQRPTRSPGCGGSGSTRSRFRKGQRYITVVVDHDTGRLVWAAEGRDKKTVKRFFDELGDERCQAVELVSSDMGEWITARRRGALPDAAALHRPFHVVKLATEALDEVRREVWNEARQPATSRRRPLAQGRPLLRSGRAPST